MHLSIHTFLPTTTSIPILAAFDLTKYIRETIRLALVGVLRLDLNLDFRKSTGFLLAMKTCLLFLNANPNIDVVTLKKILLSFVTDVTALFSMAEGLRMAAGFLPNLEDNSVRKFLFLV